MAPRANWKGYLKLSLVSCAVALFPATTTREPCPLQHHQPRDRPSGALRRGRCRDRRRGAAGGPRQGLQGRWRAATSCWRRRSSTRSRSKAPIRSRSRASSTARRVDEIYLDEVLLSRPRTTRSATRLSRSSARPCGRRGWSGIARVVLYRRERLLMLSPRGKGIVGTTLRYSDEVRDERRLFRRHSADQGLQGYARSGGAYFGRPRRLSSIQSKFEDRYETALKELIAAKQAGKKPPTAPSPQPSNVINLMDALRRSVQAERGGSSARPGRAQKRATPKATAVEARSGQAQEAQARKLVGGSGPWACRSTAGSASST